MKQLLEAYSRFDSFIKMQLLIIFVISMSWALILPIITKLQGMLWTTSIISVYFIVHKLSSFITPYFKNSHLRHVYRSLILLDILYLLLIPTYFITPLLFVYTEASVMIIYGVIITIFGISYDAFLIDKYNTNTFKDVQYAEQISMAVAGIIGYVVVILLDLVSNKLSTILMVFMCILTVNIIFQLYNYKYYWKKLKIGD